MIHESPHGLVAPYMAELSGPGEQPAVVALARARRAFEHGHHSNNAVTLVLRRVDVISAEGARSLAWLQAMLGASQASEHLLAMPWPLAPSWPRA